MTDDAFSIGKKIICILHCPDTDIVGIISRIIQNLLCLVCCCHNNLVCLCVCLLHDLMLAYQFTCLCMCFFNHAFCFLLCIRKDRILVRNDLLITLDLIRCLHTKFTEKFIDLVFIHDNLCS